MKYLAEKEIRNLISVEDIINTIENYYLDDGDQRSVVPERLFINDDENTAILMPSFYEDYYGAKVIGIAPGNAKVNEPTLRGLFVLYDRKTMNPLMTMDARTITAMRTGAVSGVGMKYLASKETNTVGIIGTGDQGWSHFQAACAVRIIKKVIIYNRSKKRLHDFLKKAEKEFPSIQIEVSNPPSIVEKADIICMTTTSKDPVIPDKYDIDLNGKHFAGSGAFKSSMQEIPTSIIKKADYIYVDSHAAFSECGEMTAAKKLGYTENSIPNLKNLVIGGENNQIKEAMTIFKSVGISILDVLTAKLIYERYMHSQNN